LLISIRLCREQEKTMQKLRIQNTFIFLRSNTSIVALVSSLFPINLAGITLVSFNTKTSPLFK
jgi:hypothetical protein